MVCAGSGRSSALRADGHRCPRRPHRRRGDVRRADRDRDGRVLRRRLVERGRGHGGRGHPRVRRAALAPLHPDGRRAARAVAADDRLLDELLLPSGRAGARLRRSGADPRRACGTRRASPAGARGASRPVVVVGLLRGEPGSQRDRRRGRISVALPLRDRLLRPRFPAGARRWESTWPTSSQGARLPLDLSPFSLDRFARGDARPEAFVI